MDPYCAGKKRVVTTADFPGGRHDNGWDACNGLWDDGSVMTYQPARRTWWGSFRVVPGYAIDTYSRCLDDFYYAGDNAPREVGVTSAAGCVSPTYDFNHVSISPNNPPTLTTGANGWAGCGAGGCNLCEGDCDSDSDCKAGLRCFHRNPLRPMHPVIGCSGAGVSGMDYCIP